MLLWCFLLMCAGLATAREIRNVTLTDKWTRVIYNPSRLEPLKSDIRWFLDGRPGSKVKIYCEDFRLSLGNGPHDGCKFAKVTFFDSFTKKVLCGTQRDFEFIGNRSRLVVDFSVNAGVGFLNCSAKEVLPNATIDEVVYLVPGGEIQRIEFPEKGVTNVDRTWRFRSATKDKISLQCELELRGRTIKETCAEDALTVDDGTGPKVFCGRENVVVISNETEITMRLETYLSSKGRIECLVQGITGPDPNEYNNVDDSEEDSSEFGTVKGLKNTTCPCGMANKDSSRIINGKQSTEGKYPFMVSIRNPENLHFCGASILTPFHILTAAHCVSSFKTKSLPNPKNLFPTVGAHHRMFNASHGQTQQLAVEEVFVPESWFEVENNLENDIAVLLLKSPIRFSRWVSPICLSPTPPRLINRFVKAMGWGVTEDGNPEYLMEANVQVVDKAICKDDPTQICFKTGKSASCNGDSGGPYVYVDPETNRYTQIGLVSSGKKGCAGKTFVGTNVASWYSWVEDIIARTSVEYDICTKVD